MKVFMIHKGKGKVTEPAVTHTVIDPESGEEQTIEDAPAKDIVITLDPGTKFGDAPILTPVLVTSEAQRAALESKGYEVYDVPKTGKVADEVASREIQANGLSGKLAQVAERDRKRALERVRRLPGANRDLSPAARAEMALDGTAGAPALPVATSTPAPAPPAASQVPQTLGGSDVGKGGKV
jgi:hypothetical protein